MHPDRVPIGAVDLRVNIDDSLREIISLGKFRKRLRKTVARGVDRRRLPRFEMFDIHPKERGPVRSHPQSRFRIALGCKYKHHSSRDGPGMRRARIGDFELSRAGAPRLRMTACWEYGTEQ